MIRVLPATGVALLALLAFAPAEPIITRVFTVTEGTVPNVEVAGKTGTAAAAATEPADSAEPKVTLAPELEVKYAEFLKQAGEARRKSWESPMETTQAEVVKAAGLSAEQAAPLKELAQQAIEMATADWLKKLDLQFRRAFQAKSQQAAALITQASTMIGAYVTENSLLGEVTPPGETAAWRDGLKRTLSPEQFVAWQQSVSDQKAKLEKEVDDALKPSEERLRASQAAPLLNRAAEIRRALKLDKERGEKLDVLARGLAEKQVTAWRNMTLQQLAALTPEERKKRIKAGRLNLASPQQPAAEQEKAWKDALATVLTAEEQGKLTANKGERRARRVKAMGQVMVQVLDDRLAFTIRQREQLQPLAERLIKDTPPLFREDTDRGYYSISTEIFCAAGAKAKDEELRPILDETQFRRWREICQGIKVDSDGDPIVTQEQEDPAQASQKAEPPSEPDDLENILSDFLARKSARMRRQCLTLALLRAEDTGRVCGLAPEVLSRLQTAARGAAETSLRDWRRDCEQNVRSNIEGTNGPALRQRLAGMEEYYFMRQTSNAPENQPIWSETIKELKSELTPPQRDALEKEETARALFRTSTVVRTVMADFDQRYLLTAEQFAKMEGLVGAMLKEYGTEIGENFANGDNAPWYLQSYYKFIPIVGIPEKTLRETLTKEQWEGWSGSREFNNCSMYWTNLEQNHARRQKQQ